MTLKLKHNFHVISSLSESSKKKKNLKLAVLQEFNKKRIINLYK